MTLPSRTLYWTSAIFFGVLTLILLTPPLLILLGVEALERMYRCYGAGIRRMGRG